MMAIYSEIRTSIRSGDLLSWSHRGWKSWHNIKIQIVRIWRRSEYSHTGTAWVIGNRVFVIEAVEPCVRDFPLSKLGNFYWLPMNAPWKAETEEAALNYIGSEYKQLRAIRANFVPLDEGEVTECAALSIAIAKHDGIDLGNIATPDAVVLRAQKNGCATYYVENI